MDIGAAVKGLVTFLNDNSGFTIVLVTVAYTLVTYAIVLEARRARLDSREAYVRVDASPWAKAHLYLAIRLENFGPAVARDVAFHFWLTDQTGAKLEQSDRSLRETVLPLGLRREALPSEDLGQPQHNLTELAASALSLHAKWSWRDGCGKPHAESYSSKISQIAADYRGSSVLIEHFPLDSLPEMKKDLDKISQALTNIERNLAESSQSVDAGA